jgi:hypothetical protein
MVAVYGSFEEVEGLRHKAPTYRKYAATVAGALAVLVVATVLVVGNVNQTTELEFKEFEPERNVFEDFDADYDDSMKFEYDLANEANWADININSGTNEAVEEGIPDPYVDQSPRIEIPEAVYTQDPPYDPTVVGLGDKIFGEPFHEYEHSEEGEAVMGKEYEDTPFDATINSVPEPNPSREWEVLDVQNEPNPNY